MPAPLDGSAVISPTRVRLGLFALGIASFGIGMTEFVAMGLLPNIAGELLPALYAADQEQANAQAGWMISAYALGVVVGAPTIAALVARYQRRSVLVWLSVAFTLATTASALLPSFGLVVAARFVAGLPHGAFFGIASLVAAQLMGPGRRARGVAMVLAGLTIANVIGVPFATWVGQHAGWRAAYLIVAAVFLLATVAIWYAIPAQAGDPAQTMRKELVVFTRVQVWFVLAIGAIGFGGLFSVYSYIAPLVTEVTGAPEGLVPWAVATLGLGMTVGNLVAGPLADRSVERTLYLFFSLMVVMLVGLALTASWTPTLFVFVFAVGFSSQGIGPTIQTRLMDVAQDSQSIAAALNHSALNTGSSLGTVLGGLAIAAGSGYVVPVWIGAALTTAGLLLSLLSFAVARRSAARELPLPVS